MRPEPTGEYLAITDADHDFDRISSHLLCPISWANSAWKTVVSPHAPDITLVGIDSRRQAIQNSQCVEDPGNAFQTGATISLLNANNGRTGDVSSIGELGLGQPTHLPPSLNIRSDVARRTTNWDWFGIYLSHIKSFREDTIAFNVRHKRHYSYQRPRFRSWDTSG